MKPRRASSPLPAFRTDDDERAFRETHSPADYFRQMRPEKVQVSSALRTRATERKQNLTLRMEPSRVR